MSYSTPFTRQTSFAAFSAENPGDQQSGVDLDAEFNAVKLAVDETQGNLALIQRADGALANGSVGLEQLDETISLGVTSRGVWVTATLYTANIDTVFHTTKLYRCNTTHTSGVFATDLAAGKWVLLADFGVQVLDVNTVATANLQDNSVSTPKIQNLAVTGAKVAGGAIALSHLAAALLTYLVPAGTVTAYGLTDEPTGWLRCNGQGVPITYPVLRAALIAAGQPFGDDGVSPRTPDLQGRQIIGRDQGAGRVTTAGSLIDGATIGASGGVETRTLFQGHLPAYTLPNTLGWAQDTGTGVSANAAIVGLNPAGHETSISAAGAVVVPTNAAYAALAINTTTTGHITGAVTSGGSNIPYGSMDPTLVLQYLIKAH